MSSILMQMMQQLTGINFILYFGMSRRLSHGWWFED